MIMKKIHLSAIELKLIKTFLFFVFIQLLIVVVFVYLFNISQPININDTNKVNITVDDAYLVTRPRQTTWMVVVADSIEYVFTNSGTLEEYSTTEIYESISNGDQLSLVYYEMNVVLFGKTNIIVDAHTENTIYRSFDEYNRGRDGTSIYILITFFVIELVFVGAFLLNVWLNHNIVKDLFRKTKRYIQAINQKL